MTKFQTLFQKQVKAWCKTQLLSIESCTLNITNFEKQIILLKKSIQSEKEERELKRQVYNSVIKQNKLQDFNKKASAINK